MEQVHEAKEREKRAQRVKEIAPTEPEAAGPAKDEPDEGARALIETRKIALLTHLIKYAVACDPDVAALVISQSEVMAEKGQKWPTFRHLCGYLHDQANQDILRVKASYKALEVPARCKTVAALYAYCLHRIEPEIDKLRDPEELEDLEAWKLRIEAIHNAVRERFAAETYQYYLVVANDRERWRKLPPFLAR